MIKKIFAKLQEELGEPICSELQVVYLLVQIRKLLEVEGDKDKHFALAFYCSWAVHPWMEKAGARRIVERFNSHQQSLETALKTGEESGIDWNAFEDLVKTIRFLSFRQALAAYLSSNGLPSRLTDDDACWATFLRYYSAVVHDCPLRCKDPSCRFTSEVTVRLVDMSLYPEDAFGKDTSLVVRWSWKSNNTGKEAFTDTHF